MESIFEEIARRIDYPALFSEYLRIKRRGSRLVALCPFHQEKEPSFYIDAHSGLWHCFGCKAGGNVFQFIARIEKLEMKDVVELLARKYGVDTSKFEKGVQREKLSKRSYFIRILRASAKFFFNELRSTTHGREALEYLKQRGVKEVTMERFAIGLTPVSEDGLAKFLLSRNVKRDVLEQLGLISRSRRGGEPVDFFRNRIIFPIFNHRGEIVSFAGRTIKNEEPKYLNTSNTPIYNKSAVLYGLNFAKKAITEKDAVYVVEGYMDVIMLHQAGVTNAVATCGTALTTEHIRELGRFTDNFYLAFDGDSAGISAALRAGSECLAQGFFPQILLFKEGKDPADIIKEQGREGFERFAQHGIITTYPRLLASIYVRTDEPDEKVLKKLFEQARQTYRRIPDSITASAFSKELADALKFSEKAVVDLLRSGKVFAPSPKVAQTIKERLKNPHEKLFVGFFSLLLCEPKLVAQAKGSGLTSADFPEGIYRQTWEQFVEKGLQADSVKLDEKVRNLLAELKNSDIVISFPLKSYVRKIKQLKVEAINEKIRLKKRELNKAIEAGDESAALKLRNELEDLLKKQKEAIKALSLPQTQEQQAQKVDEKQASKWLGRAH